MGWESNQAPWLAGNQGSGAPQRSQAGSKPEGGRGASQNSRRGTDGASTGGAALSVQWPCGEPHEAERRQEPQLRACGLAMGGAASSSAQCQWPSGQINS